MRLVRFLEDETRATDLPLGALLATAVALHVWVTVQAVNPWHADEHFQILGFAWARAGLASVETLPWEWDARIRPTLQPTLALGALGSLRAAGVTSPFAWVLLLRLASVAAAFAVLLRVLAHASPHLTRAGRQALWCAGLLLWFTPLFFGRFTSENWSGMALALALTLLPGSGATPRRDALAGALLGLSFLFRYQMAMAVLPALAWVAAEGGRRRALRMGLAAAAVAAAGSLLDAWFYGEWVLAPWNYLRVNLLEGVAAGFGVSPWWSYLAWVALLPFPPVGVPLLLLATAGALARPRSPWAWTAAAILVGHSLLAHKEPRFLLPLLYLLPVLLARGVEAFAGWTWTAGLGRALLVVNVALLALPATPALHRAAELDGHYLRALWERAEAHPGETVWVLQDEGTPYLALDLAVEVYRHPRVRGVAHRAGDPVPSEVPPGTPPERLLVLTHGDEAPSVDGAAVGAPAYRAEPGWRVMARAAGVEGAAWVRFLEDRSGWTGSRAARRLHEVRTDPGPGAEGGA